MSRKIFTEKDLTAISSNPNVEKATERSIKYTNAFQEKAYSESLEGKPIMEIFRDSGFDVTVLGIYRIHGFKAKLMRKAEREGGFEDLRRGNYRRGAKTGKETTEKRIKRLEHELTIAQQELEFLKKIQAANMESQKRWESKQRHRKNTN